MKIKWNVQFALRRAKKRTKDEIQKRRKSIEQWRLRWVKMANGEHKFFNDRVGGAYMMNGRPAGHTS